MKPAPALLSVLVLLASGACVRSRPAEAPQVASRAVPEGINAPFLDPEADVGIWVARFEGESREIAVQREAIADTLELEPGEDVADVGSGTGLFLAPLHSRTAPGGVVYAVDIAPRFLEHLEARAAEEGLDRVRTVQASQTSARLAFSSVDAVFICDTYHHFEQPQATLRSLRAALRPGGRLVVVDFERTPGESSDWAMEHVRAGKAGVLAEIEAAGFRFQDEPSVEGLSENYVLRFRRP